MNVYVLLVSQGGSGQSKQQVIKRGGNSLGRESGNDIVLDANGVSRYHARIMCQPEGCSIEDLGSTNGTKVNGQALKEGFERPLKHNDRVEIGPFVLRFLVVDENNLRDRKKSTEQLQQTAVGSSSTTDGAVSTEQNVPPKPLTTPPEVVTIPSITPIVVRQPTRITQLPARGERSSYFDLLPPFYEESDLQTKEQILRGLLLICESILHPLDRVIDQLHYYLDPDVAPGPMLPWLAFWVDLVLNENWPLARRRELIRRATELYRQRGTRRGLHDYLQIYTEVDPTIVEPGEEMLYPLPTNVKRALPFDGSQVQLAELEEQDKQYLPEHTFRVVLDITNRPEIDLAMVQQIIEAEKPAHTSYMLYVRASSSK